jgi:hypothetical protein
MGVYRSPRQDYPNAQRHFAFPAGQQRRAWLLPAAKQFSTVAFVH